MALPTRPVIIGSKFKFMRDGTAFTIPSAGTSGAAAVAGFADTGWISIGKVKDCSVNRQTTDIEIEAPVEIDGEYHMDRLDVIPISNKLDLSFTTQEFSPLALEVIFGTGSLTSASTGWTAGADAEKRGWVFMDFGDHTDVKLSRVPFYGLLKVDGEASFGGGKEFTVKFAFRTLKNALAVAITGP